MVSLVLSHKVVLRLRPSTLKLEKRNLGWLKVINRVVDLVSDNQHFYIIRISVE
jgi:hypothetical protein